MFQIEIENGVFFILLGFAMSLGASVYVSRKRYGFATWCALLAIANFIQAGVYHA